MNILLYVTALITALSIMTYSRLSSFLHLMTIRQETACYMGEKNREDFNKKQQKNYDEHHGEGTERGSARRVDASKKLNFIVYVNPQIRNQNDSAYKTFDIITRQLLTNLYQNESFFKQVQESRGNAIDALLSRLMQVTETNGKKGTVNTTGEIKAVDLQDAELQELFAKMLAGSEALDAQKCTPTEEKGYDSLLNYIEVTKRKDSSIKPIRIQLAPRKLLEAIFIDPNTVEEIITMRKVLQSQAGKIDTPEQQVASDQFQRLFKGRVPGNLDVNLFNFEITKTAIEDN